MPAASDAEKGENKQNNFLPAIFQDRPPGRLSSNSFEDNNFFRMLRFWRMPEKEFLFCCFIKS
jgi:hypothetical protein